MRYLPTLPQINLSIIIDSVINQQGRHVVHKKPSVRKESTDEMDEYIMLIVQHE